MLLYSDSVGFAYAFLLFFCPAKFSSLLSVFGPTLLFVNFSAFYSTSLSFLIAEMSLEYI